MKQTNTFDLIILRWFYNIYGDIDEFTLSQINHFGNKVSILSQFTIMIALLAILANQSAIACLILFSTLTITSIKQERLIHHLGLDQLEIKADELVKARQQMFRRTSYQTLTVFVFNVMLLVFLWNIQTPDSTITRHEYIYQFSPIILTISCLGSFIFFFILNRHKIKIID